MNEAPRGAPVVGFMPKILLSALLWCLVVPAGAAQTLVAMTDQGASTFYVEVSLEGLGPATFLVDTGSSYTAINRSTLQMLQETGRVEYVKDLEGILADGSSQVVPVFLIRSMLVGGTCVLNDVRAAVFPGNTRNILGLSALRQAAPFVFSVEPPTLELSNCGLPHATLSDPEASGTGG